MAPTDVTDPDAVEALFGGLDRLDVLFNNAGTFGPSQPLEVLPVDAWRHVVDTNLTGAFLCAQAAFRVDEGAAPARRAASSTTARSPPTCRARTRSRTRRPSTRSPGSRRRSRSRAAPYDIACGQIDVGNAATEMTAAMERGVPQADGSIAAEPTMDVRHTAEAVVFMAGLPLDANVEFMTILATKMPFIGRG